MNLVLKRRIQNSWAQTICNYSETINPDSVKSVTGGEILCKHLNCWYFFYEVNGVFEHVEKKSKNIRADLLPQAVIMSHNHNLGTLCALPPVYDRVMTKNTK